MQLLYRGGDDPTPVLAAVGAMQFEVLAHRMAHEFGAEIEIMGPYARTVRRTDASTAAAGLGQLGGAEVLARRDGVLLAVFESPYWLARVAADHPDWVLEPIVTT